MFPAGGGFGDLFICFQCIKAARLKPNEKTLLMASLGGSVEFNRMTKQLRQLFRSPNSTTKEDISPAIEERSPPQGEDLSYEAPAAFRKQQKQRTGPPLPIAHPRNLQGKSPNRRKGRRGKMDLIGELGTAIGVIAVGVNITSSPNVRLNRSRKLLPRRRPHLRIHDRLPPQSPWRIPRRRINRRNTP